MYALLTSACLPATGIIRQMQGKMNKSEPLPITMPYDKYKEGVRDVIYFDDKRSGICRVKEVFDFISSDDKSMQVQYQSGDLEIICLLKTLRSLSTRMMC